MLQQPRVLVIDDDELIRRALGRNLRDLNVMMSDNGPSALAFLADRGMQFDAIVCDMRMEIMDGATFYRALLKIRPDLARRVVFITGNAAGPNVETFLTECGQPFLEKPFTTEALKAAIADVAARKRPGLAAGSYSVLADKTSKTG
jgi:CheY-like chemotaxis protein